MINADLVSALLVLGGGQDNEKKGQGISTQLGERISMAEGHCLCGL